MEKKDIITLIRRIISGTSVKGEEDVVNTHFNESFHKQEWNDMKWGSKEDVEHRISERVKEQIALSRKPYVKSVFRRYLPYAAAFFLFSILGGLIWNVSREDDHQGLTHVSDALMLKPGEDRALLELSGGEIIDLENLTVGEVYVKEGFSVRKTESGVLEYVHNTSDRVEVVENKWNTLRTPLGGKYHIVLADGTKVWMNAGSSLSFPEQFAGNQRVVKATGEIYFEVSHDETKPFIVSSNGVDIKVLGTAFNLSAYQDVNQHSVSLVTGSVELVTKKGITKLIPGQKGIVSELGVQIGAFDVESELAWKDNYFVFKDRNIKEIMAALARWYDAEIEYNGLGWDDVNFTIRISRREDIKEILSIIELTKSVKFQIKGRRVVVSK